MATFHMPGGAFHAPHSTTPEGSPRVHPGLFRPPPQSPGMANPFCASSTTPTGSPAFRPYLSHRPQQAPHQDFFQMQAQDQPRRQINTAVLRGPLDSSRSPIVSSPSAKRKRADGLPFDAASLLNKEWGTSPAFGPVVTPANAYSDGMGGIFNPFGGDLADSGHSDVDDRRRGGSSRPESRSHVYSEKTTPSQGQPGWFTLNTLGGVIGKVLDFCTAGAFRGFYAGGGTAYNIESDGTVNAARMDEDRDDEAEFYDAHQELEGDRVLTDAPPTDADAEDLQNELMSPIHQTWPTGLFRGQQQPEPEEPIPAPKRRQVAEPNEELRNWVMVPPESTECQRASAITTATSSPSGSLGFRRSRLNPAVRRAGAQSLSAASSGLPRRPQYARTLHTPHASIAGAAFGGVEFGAGQIPERGVSPAPSTPSRIPVSAGVSSIPRPKPVSQIPTRPSSSASSVSMTGLSSSSFTMAPSSSSFSMAPSSSSFSNGLASQPSHLSPHHNAAHRRNHSVVSQTSTMPRRPSFASSMAGPTLPSTPSRTRGDVLAKSPHLTPEARQFARQRAQDDRETDVRMESINAQLEGLIRMGREALGSSIEVVDEGWMDED